MRKQNSNNLKRTVHVPGSNGLKNVSSPDLCSGSWEGLLPRRLRRATFYQRKREVGFGKLLNSVPLDFYNMCQKIVEKNSYTA